jgi:pimeloyl-ACP methyl ester carboxylesterase
MGRRARRAHLARMAKLTRDGTVLTYDEQGKGGPPLVFIHGLAPDPRLWRHQIDRFARERRVVALTMRGFGETAPAGNYGIDVFAEDIAWACDALALDRPIVIGHSAGALFGLAAAARRPDLVRGLALIDPPAFLLPEAMKMFGEVAAGFASPAYEEVLVGFATGFAPPSLHAEIAACVRRLPQHVVLSTWQSLFAFDLEAALARAPAPKVFVHAAIPCDTARMAAHGEVVTVPGGHFPHVTEPERVNAAIGKLLA